jgi:hypothetical protein
MLHIIIFHSYKMNEMICQKRQIHRQKADWYLPGAEEMGWGVTKGYRASFGAEMFWK